MKYRPARLRLVDLIEKLGLSNARLASEIYALTGHHVSSALISKVRLGRQPPSLYTAFAIARFTSTKSCQELSGLAPIEPEDWIPSDLPKLRTRRRRQQH
jgi:hypothetical protein